MTTEYNWPEIYETALKFAPDCVGWGTLAHKIGIPIRTLSDAMRREFGIETFAALVAQSDETESLKVWQQKAKHFERLSVAYEKRLTNRHWLRDEVAALAGAWRPIPIPKEKSRKSDFKEQVAVLLYSDAHDGLFVPEGQMGVFGTYSSEICAARTIYTFQTFARLAQQQSFPVHKARIYLLGDNVEHSFMRPGQAQQTDAHVVKQTLHISGILASAIQHICGEFKEVEVCCVPGNHGRATARYGENLPDETYDHLAYHLIARTLSQQRNLKVNIHEAWYFLDNIFGFKFLGTHLEDALAWSGVPYYGIERAVKDYGMMFSEVTMAALRELPAQTQMTVEQFMDNISWPDFVCIGHFHNRMMWPVMGVEVLANGALSGVSIYSVKKLRRLTPPSQLMFFVHPEWGVSLRCPIDLSRIK